MANVLDIECYDWDQFLVGALWRDDGSVLVTRDESELVDAVLGIDGEVWAHNGGRYDWLWLLDRLSHTDESAEIFMSGSAATSIHAGNAHLRDSYRLLPMALNKAAQIVGQSKAELGGPCDCGRNCGGYCTLAPDMSDARWKRTIDYLVQDCRALSDVLDFVAEYSADNGIELRGTVGSTAWATAKAIADLPNADYEPSQYPLIRAGYYGGRTECHRMRADYVVGHDIHSAYPAALVKIDVPVGKPKPLDSRAAASAFERGRPGIYHCEVDVPESMAPPLPWRGQDRLYFPHGRFSGAWTEIELRHALNCGVKILAFDIAFVWPSAENILREPCEHIWNLRAREAERNPALARWLKWVANSLTGKFAQDPESHIHALDRSGNLPTACPGGACLGFCTPSRCCDHQCSGQCERWESDDPLGRIWSRVEWRQPACGHIIWAAYLTAATRVELHNQINHATDSWVYSDTDSVYATRQLSRNIGPNLGQFGIEKEGSNWRCIAPKAYAFDSADGPVIRCKGLGRISPADFERYCNGEPVVVDQGVMGLKSAARLNGPLFRRRKLTRKAVGKPQWCGGRLIGQGGRTYAPDATMIGAD